MYTFGWTRLSANPIDGKYAKKFSYYNIITTFFIIIYLDLTYSYDIMYIPTNIDEQIDFWFLRGLCILYTYVVEVAFT